jgi:ubiquitin-protein ligase
MQITEQTEQPGYGGRNNRITYEELIHYQVLDIIASTYTDENNAALLLDKIGFPENLRPPFSEPVFYWRTVCMHISKGRTQGGFEDLLIRSLDIYPFNQPIRNFLNTKHIDVPAEKGRGTNINIYEPEGAQLSDDQLTALLRTAVNQAGISAQIEISFRIRNHISIFINSVTPQVVHFQQQLQNILPMGYEASILSQDSLPDYLIRQFYVEGPDQRRLLYTNIPASTSIQDIGNSVSQYYGQAWPENTSGNPRNATIDVMRPNGISERINNPLATLHESGIQENTVTQVSTETTAAHINPQIREQALVRVRNEVEAFCKKNSTITMEKNYPTLPTLYILTFTANGWAMPRHSSELPSPQTRHQVSIFLGANFPLRAPEVHWQEPVIFHPNVHPKTGRVCLGDLEDCYQPGLNMEHLCQTIIDVADYINYQPDSCLNPEAGQWAKSQEGQSEIIRHGGRPYAGRSESLAKSTPLFDIKEL